jgi:hypothetical protein
MDYSLCLLMMHYREPETQSRVESVEQLLEVIFYYYYLVAAEDEVMEAPALVSVSIWPRGRRTIFPRLLANNFSAGKKLYRG